MTDFDARREVLTRFMVACDPVPTQAQLADWQARHPDLATELAEFAEAMAQSPGEAWVDDGRGPEQLARSSALVAALEGAFDFLRPRRRGRGRRRGATLTRT